MINQQYIHKVKIKSLISRFLKLLYYFNYYFRIAIGNCECSCCLVLIVLCCFTVVLLLCVML